MADPEAGDPIDVALVRADARRKLFGSAEKVTIGRYEVQARLGAGGMGIVFRAVDPDLGRTVAIKLLHAMEDEAGLLAEARALAKLRHLNVVAVHDVGTWQGRVFITMEHVPGRTLRAWLRERPRAWREVIEVLGRAARGLGAAHRAGLVHRDVKPENVLVGEDGEVRVVDFGLARGSGGADGAARPAGTPGYAAPEVVAGAPGDAASDQFGFCVMLYEGLFGERPGAGATPPSDRGVPAHVRRELARGLAADPAGRHPSMDALIAALSRDPGRTVRRAALAAAAVVGVAALAVVVVPRGKVAPCGESGARLAGVWTPARRQALHGVFAASKVPYAETSFASVAAALDEYTGAWTRAQHDSCEATVVRHEQSPELQDRRTGCLEARRASLVATLELLGRGERDTIERAVRLVELLPRVDACNDLAALQAPVAPPADPAARARLAEMQARLAEVDALTNAAHLDDAIERGGKLVADARALGYRPFLAETLVELGEAQRTKGDVAAAGASWREALAEAQAGGHDLVVARAADFLCSIHPDEGLQLAHEWARLAGATIERLGSPPAQVAQHESALSKLLHSEGKDKEAIEHIRKALAENERAGQAGTLAQADYFNNLGAVLGMSGETVESIEWLDKALALRERLLGGGHPQVASVLYNIALMETNLGHWQQALDRLDRAYAIAVALGRPMELVSQILDGKAGALDGLGRAADAIEVMRESVEVLEKGVAPGDVRLAGAYTNLGIGLANLKKFDEAVTYYDRALAIRQAAGSGDHPEVAVALYNRGNAYLALGRPADSRADCERAADIVSKAYDETYPQLMPFWICVGKAFTAEGKPEQALVPLGRALALAEKTPTYPTALPGAQLALAQALRAAGREPGRAGALAREALARFKELGDAEGVKESEAFVATAGRR